MEIQIRRPVNLTIHGFRRLCLPPERVRVADEIATRLIAQDKAVPVEPTEQPGETPDPTVEAVVDFDALTVEQLQAIADERGLEVKGTGSGDKVVKGDLVAALTAE